MNVLDVERHCTAAGTITFHVYYSLLASFGAVEDHKPSYETK